MKQFIWLLLVHGIVGLYAIDLPADDSQIDAATQTAQEIDRLIAERQQQESVTPAPIADDAEFLRRVHLDICGKIPPASTVRDFVRDDSPTKRRDIVERLIESPSYVIHYTNLWRAAMIPEADSDQAIRIALPGFESWLRSRIAENRNFAEIVTEILELPIDSNNMRAFAQPDTPSPAAFYQAKEAKPELLAAATARLFLGVRIDCAQCHDHPFDNWKQEQFWQHAAFFTDINVQTDGLGVVTRVLKKPGMIEIPDKDKSVSVQFLNGEAPAKLTGLRSSLAEWIVSPDNPYFAKAAVNRIWSYHFGIGLVDPMDDFSPHNPASHPELLELLAKEFVAHDYDFKFIIRAITSSQTYQRTSRRTDPSQEHLTVYGRMPVRGLSPEQIFDSLAQATGYRQPFDPEQPLNFNNDQNRQQFLATFSNQSESATDRASTILQALSLMNGNFVSNATDLADSRTLAAVVDAPFLDMAEKIDALYLSTLSRYPHATEREHLQQVIESANDQQAVLSDIFWALLNSSEFLLNH